MTLETSEKVSKPIGSYKQFLTNEDQLILQLRKAELNHRRGLSCEDDETDPSQSETGSNFGRLELGSTYEWSDSSSLSSPMEGDFHDSIEAIRQEAARIDTIMALDQLDTMKQELNSVKKILEARRMEVHDLRELVSLKDDLLCTMELERDLYKGEVAKLKDQLAAALSGTACVSEDLHTPTVHVTTIHAVDETEPIVLLPSAKTAATTTPEVANLEPKIVQLSPPNRNANTGMNVRSSREDARDHSVVDQIRGKEDTKSCIFAPRALFRKKRRSDCRDENIRELGRLLRTSLDTNEELRKRIAMLSAYYENVVERMQNNLNEAHSERQRVATDLAKQIVEMDKKHRHQAEDLERRLRQKERELATVQEVQL
eukprot:scaffold2476_cov193-Amphora_coffeaeformis.AAC.15